MYFPLGAVKEFAHCIDLLEMNLFHMCVYVLVRVSAGRDRITDKTALAQALTDEDA